MRHTTLFKTATLALLLNISHAALAKGPDLVLENQTPFCMRIKAMSSGLEGDGKYKFVEPNTEGRSDPGKLDCMDGLKFRVYHVSSCEKVDKLTKYDERKQSFKALFGLKTSVCERIRLRATFDKDKPNGLEIKRVN